MFSKISLAFRALRAGSMLTDPAIWKVRQNAANAVYALLGVVAAALPIMGVTMEISNEDLMLVAGGVATIGGLLNNYLTTATTEKIGVHSKAKVGNDESVPDGCEPESDPNPSQGHFNN